MSLRRLVGAAAAVLVCVGLIALNWPRSDHDSATAAPPTTTTTSTSTTTTAPAPVDPFTAADAIVSEVKLYDAPGATESSGSLPNPTVEKVPLAFLVREQGPPGWLKVQIARRPNESTAWIHAEDVSLRPLENRIVIERDARRLTVYRGLTDEVLFQTTVADGAPATPTPLGKFFIDVALKLTNPNGAYGAYQLSVAGFSDVLQSFGGGPGQIAIHGTNHPELIGQFVSNGCIRLTNDDVTTLADMAPVGTPVDIVA